MQADQKIYDFMYERIPAKIRDMEVLEIATGPGLLAKPVAPAAKRMIATDYSDGMIAEAKKGECPANLTFEVADAMNLPYADGSFDAVLIANALHIVPDPEKALSIRGLSAAASGPVSCRSPGFGSSINGRRRSICGSLRRTAGVYSSAKKWQHGLP